MRKAVFFILICLLALSGKNHALSVESEKTDLLHQNELSLATLNVDQKMQPAFGNSTDESLVTIQFADCIEEDFTDFFAKQFKPLMGFGNQLSSSPNPGLALARYVVPAPLDYPGSISCKYILLRVFRV